MNQNRAIRVFLGLCVACALIGWAFAGVSHATEPQIPNIFLNNKTKLDGQAKVYIEARSVGGYSGTFKIAISANCVPPNYPAGRVEMSIDMSDSSILYLRSTTVEALSSTGRHSPTAYIMGRCNVQAPNAEIRGCHYWITLADNGKGDRFETPDIVGFLVLDGFGNRIAYGTGPVVDGDIFVNPTPF